MWAKRAPVQHAITECSTTCFVKPRFFNKRRRRKELLSDAVKVHMLRANFGHVCDGLGELPKLPSDILPRF